jgi:hypothetical protein
MSHPELTYSKTVTIAAGASLSDAATFPGYRLVGFTTDAAWDTQAVTFQTTYDGTNYANHYNEATEYSQAAITASTNHSVNVESFLGVRGVKVRSGTAGAAANQVDATVVTLRLMPI